MITAAEARLKLNEALSAKQKVQVVALHAALHQAVNQALDQGLAAATINIPFDTDQEIIEAFEASLRKVGGYKTRLDRIGGLSDEATIRRLPAVTLTVWF